MISKIISKSRIKRLSEKQIMLLNFLSENPLSTSFRICDIHSIYSDKVSFYHSVKPLIELGFIEKVEGFNLNSEEVTLKEMLDDGKALERLYPQFKTGLTDKERTENIIRSLRDRLSTKTKKEMRKKKKTVIFKKEPGKYSYELTEKGMILAQILNGEDPKIGCVVM